MEINKLLRNILVGGLFIIPFIPFVVIGSFFFPFITGKNFLFRFLVEFLFVVWGLLLLRGAIQLRFSALIASFAAFLGIMGIATALSEFPLRSFWSNFERMEGLVTLIHLFGYLLLLLSAFRTDILWDRFFKTTLGASILMSVYGLFQLGGIFQIHQGSTRLDGTLGNATYLAVYLIFHIFIAALLALRSSNRITSYFYSGVILLETFILYHTATRGAILGLIGGALLSAIILVIFEKEQKTLRRVALGILASVVIIVGGFFLIKDIPAVAQNPVLGRFSSISFEEQTTKSRFMVWNMAWQGFKERPVFGWGQESFNYVFNKYYDPKMYSQEPWFDRTHNVFLDWLISGGVLGLLSYLSLFGVALWYLWFSRRFSVSEKAVFTGLLGAYFFHNLFVFDNIVSYIFFVTILGYIAWRVAPQSEEGQSQEISSTRFLIGAPILIALVFVSMYFFVIRGVLASTTLITAISIPVEQSTARIDPFKRALAYNSFANQEIREQILQSAINVRNQNIDLGAKQAMFDLAKTEMDKMIEEAPSDARHRLFYGALLNIYGFSAEGLVQLQKARELSPRKQQILFELGLSYINAKDYKQALSVFKEAYESDTSFEDARVIYAMGAIYAGERDLERTLLKEISERSHIDSRLLQAYMDTGRSSEAIAALSKAILAEQNNLELRLRRAEIHYRLGNTSLAISDIKYVMDREPSFKAQGEQIIREIEKGALN